MSGADRLRRHRERRACGRSVFRIEAPRFDLADALTHGGFLECWDADDHAAIEAALERMVEVFIKAAEIEGA
jgi:hypothetical protein